MGQGRVAARREGLKLVRRVWGEMQEVWGCAGSLGKEALGV